MDSLPTLGVFSICFFKIFFCNHLLKIIFFGNVINMYGMSNILLELKYIILLGNIVKNLFLGMLDS